MSTGERAPSRGFTFLEVTIVMALLAMLGLIVERTLTSSHENERYLDAARRVTKCGQDLTHELYTGVGASRRLLHADAEGRAYLDALDLSRFLRTASSRLPVLDETGALEPDREGEPLTGNVLLFVDETDAAACVAEPAAGRLCSIDLYRFVCVYPTQTLRRLVPQSEEALDLVHWRSVPFASRPQILAIQDADERRAVVRDLVERYGTNIAWDPDGGVDAAFYALDGSGLLADVPESAFVVEADPDASSWGRLVNRGVQLARTQLDEVARRPLFAAEDPSVWAPDGFEVKLVGRSGSRKVWLHLVVAAPTTRGRSTSQANTVIVSVRDL